MSRPLSILLLGTQMATGGAQKLLLEQADWYAAHGHHVVAAFFYDRDGVQSIWEQRADYPLYNLKAFSNQRSLFRRVMQLIAGFWALWKLLGSRRFDVVITFTHDSNVLGLPLAWLARVPVRIATHLGGIRNIPRWREITNSWLVNAGIGQVLVAASEKTGKNAIKEGVHAERIVVIHNGIEPFELEKSGAARVRRQLGLKEDDILLLTIGRLVYEKGHEFFIQAMSAVSKKYPKARAFICGEGPLREKLQQEISANSLTDHVRLLGYWDDVHELLAAADIFVLPSRWEGLPLALLEGMAAGLPVVSTEVQGAEEVIKEGVHGFITPLEDTDALGEAILKLVSDPVARKKMGAAARLRVLDHYTVDHMCRKYLDLIQRKLS